MSDYEFKNTALAKLYEKFMNNGPWVTVKAVDGMSEAFKECDETLADIQDQCDHWKTMYGNACGDQDVLKESIRLLDGENRRLRQKVSDQEKEINQRRKDNEALERVIERNVGNDIANKEIIDQLRKENDKLKGESGFLISSRDAWRTRAEHAEAEVEKLAKENDIVAARARTIYELREENEDLKKAKMHLEQSRLGWVDRANKSVEEFNLANKEITELKNRLDKANADRTERENEAMRELVDVRSRLNYCTHSRDTWRSRSKHAEAEVEELAKKCDKLLDENEDLKKKLTEANDILEKTNRDRNEWRRRALLTKLTTKVPDIKEEYTMTVTMDKADHNDLMKLLWNKSFGASPEYMRDFLKAFCDDHDSCRVCPLKECGSDLGICFDTMSDEEIEKYYKIAIRCNT